MIYNVVLVTGVQKNDSALCVCAYTYIDRYLCIFHVHMCACMHIYRCEYTHTHTHIHAHLWRMKWQLQYSCLGDPMNRGAWWVTVHYVIRVIHGLVTQ